jgi:5-formyltetrahydrofolate cyclo-ligase
MAPSCASEKSELRRRARALRDAAPADLRAQWSERICARAVSHPAYLRARTVHVFLSFQSEVDTTSIVAHALASGRRVVVPIFLGDSAETPATQITTLADDAFVFGRWGMRTPRERLDVPLDEIDVAFVPLVCFGAVDGGRWARIGYGAGYYDGLLARLRADVPRIGIAFALQRFDHLPVEPHDALLDEVLSEVQ